MDNDQACIIVVAAILFVCLVVGVVSCIYVLNSSKEKDTKPRVPSCLYYLYFFLCKISTKVLALSLTSLNSL